MELFEQIVFGAGGIFWGEVVGHPIQQCHGDERQADITVCSANKPPPCRAGREINNRGGRWSLDGGGGGTVDGTVHEYNIYACHAASCTRGLSVVYVFYMSATRRSLRGYLHNTTRQRFTVASAIHGHLPPCQRFTDTAATSAVRHRCACSTTRPYNPIHLRISLIIQVVCKKYCKSVPTICQ